MPEVGGPPRLHDVLLYGAGSNTLYGYFYGDPTTLRVGGETLELTRGGVNSPWEVSGALLVNGEPHLQQRIPPLEERPFSVQRVPMSTDLVVRAGEGLASLVYFDGARWFTLLEDPQPGLNARVVPRERTQGLRGLGNLTREEAETLETVLAETGPLALGVLDEPQTPPRRVGGLDEYLRTALVVQSDIATDATAVPTPVRELAWEVLARGNQAVAGEQRRFEIASSQSELVRLWNEAYGSQLELPPIPNLDFRRQSVLGLFLETKPTGGYGIEVQDVSLEDGEVYVDVALIEPRPGAITTQALTTPWVLIRVPREEVDVAWFRDARTGDLLGVARNAK